MSQWSEGAVSASITVDEAVVHQLVLDSDVRLLDHSDDEAIVVALGAPKCPCYVIQAGWRELHADVGILPLLLQPLGPDAALRERPGIRTPFLRAVWRLDSSFRSAMARRIAEALPARWCALISNKTTARAIEQAVRIVLHDHLPRLDQTKVEIHLVEHDAKPTRLDEVGSASVAIGPRWLIDVAAEGQVDAWWKSSWS